MAPVVEVAATRRHAPGSAHSSSAADSIPNVSRNRLDSAPIASSPRGTATANSGKGSASAEA
ncbi:hypothetical protein ABIA35_007402 [Catenulispora sp. MAP12-49]|uniref:hypothetical protein n=1 Tax=unclassified Catenulispora TaxID=414885 RepID=UPI0035193074